MKRAYGYGEEELIEERILSLISQGESKLRASARAGIHRTTLNRWLDRKPRFREAFWAACLAGEQKRDYLCWVRHPFRGLRPPSSKRTRAKPRYR